MRNTALSQSLCFGNSNKSDNIIGIDPTANDSHNLIEFGPEPDGHKL